MVCRITKLLQGFGINQLFILLMVLFATVRLLGRSLLDSGMYEVTAWPTHLCTGVGGPESAL